MLFKIFLVFIALKLKGYHLCLRLDYLLAFFQEFFPWGEIYCYANFFCYANFSIVFGPNFFLGGGKSLKLLDGRAAPPGSKPALITFVVLDCFTVEFSELGLRIAHLQWLSNRPSKSLMTFIDFA